MGFLSVIAGGIVDANKLVKQGQAQKDDSVQNVVVNRKYSIDVPSFLSPLNKKLNEDASLIYGSRSLDISFLIIDEPKSDFIQSVKEMQMEFPDMFSADSSLLKKMSIAVLYNMFDIDKVEISNYCETQINGLNAIKLNVFQNRTFLKDALYASYAFVEGKETLYQIQILSGGTSITKLADKMERAIMSFKELG